LITRGFLGALGALVVNKTFPVSCSHFENREIRHFTRRRDDATKGEKTFTIPQRLPRHKENLLIPRGFLGALGALVVNKTFPVLTSRRRVVA
jgi:hypothetical protein